MSSRAENWAWERDDVKGITKFVLVYLARRAYYDDGAAAWPSVKTMAEETEKKGTVKVWFPNTVGVPDERIQRMPKEENFWDTGQPGPAVTHPHHAQQHPGNEQRTVVLSPGSFSGSSRFRVR
mgnify:CR=1 FL=1